MGVVKNLIGQQFGKWKVIEFDSVKSHSGARWKVLCECGKIKIVYAKTLREKHSTSCGCSYHLKPGNSSRNSLFRIYKKGASKRNLDFSLTIDQFSNLTSSNCYYCNKEPAQIHQNNKRYMSSYVYNGIDRINNRVGYSFSNCVPCCGQCNWMKGKQSSEEFIKKCKEIANRF